MRTKWQHHSRKCFYKLIRGWGHNSVGNCIPSMHEAELSPPYCVNQVWWGMPGSPAFGEDKKFWVILVYTVNLRLVLAT